MVKILFIIPYKEIGPYVQEYIKQCAVTDVDFQVVDIYGTNEKVINEYQADIVVARGMTGYAFMRGRPDVHFVEIPVTSYDVLSAVNNLRKRHSIDKITIIWPKNIHFELLEEIFGISITQYIVENESGIKGLLDLIEEEGGSAVIGGLTVGRYCRARNMLYAPIYTTEETLERALDETINMAHGINMEKRKTNLMKPLLDYSKESICVVDTEGRILNMNRQFFCAFELQNERQEMMIDEAVGEDSWWKNKKQLFQKESIQKLRNRLMVVMCIPIKVDEMEELYLISFQDAEEIRNMEYKIRKQLREQGLVAKYRFENILGQSAAMKQLVTSAKKYSQSDANILILGESGTGKEMFAQSIHNASRRCNKPFVAINCAALPEQLLESELFGYVEGTFTGAVKGGKAGLFEQAHKGTIFLDEIGEMPLPLQVKLLRVLQEKEVRRLGDNKVIPIDVRVICATNVNIEEMVKEGKFRLDLFYRINLLSLYVPSLRERPGDVLELFMSFINKYSRRMGIEKCPQITEDAAALLEQHKWQGNVRELQNFSERILILGEGNVIDREMMKLAGIFDRVTVEEDKTAEVNNKKETGGIDGDELLIQTLTKKHVTKDELAKRLGISRSTLYRRLKELRDQEES